MKGLEVATREDLIALLYEAAELEHGLCCSYLYAAFSLRIGDDRLQSREREAVERWRDVIAGVATEEMLHLALVANLLSAVGAAPHFGRPGFPQCSRFYPGGISISLRRFDDDTISRFMHLERPLDVDIEDEIVDDPDVDLDAAPPESPPGALTLTEETPTPDPESLATVGQLYEAIEDGFGELDRHLGHDQFFVGPRTAQVTEETFKLPGLTAVTDLDSARAALSTVVDQGEGVRGDWTDAHYGRFRRIREELRSLTASSPDFEPSWPCVDNPVGCDTVPASEQTAVTSDVAKDLLVLFNNSYALMTTMLLRSFAHSDEEQARVDALAESAMRLMTTVLGPVGSLLATLPAEDNRSTTAGPSFEFHRVVSLVPQPSVAWQVLTERLREVAEFANGLRASSGLDGLASVSENLNELATSLTR